MANFYLTCDQSQSTKTGERGNVDLERVQAFAELEDTVQPVSERALALLFAEDHAVAEGHLSVVASGPIGQPQDEQLQTRGLEQQFLILDAQVRKTGQFIGEILDHVHRGGQQVVELLHFVRFRDDGLVWGRFPVLGIVQAGDIWCCVHMCSDKRCDH